MTLTQSLQLADAGLHRAGIAPRRNVIPFPSPRVLLPVTLRDEADNLAHTQLVTLLHSPLGVYVVNMETVRDGVRVRFDIAADDLGFTLHTLISTLPEATIGAVMPRESAKDMGATAMSQ
jgi:hypothetical protein